MIIGIPKEIKDSESRVGLTPSGARTLADAGHTVLVEAGAGEGSGIPDAAYRAANGQMSQSAEEIWARADMVVKVKGPQGPEYGRMRPNQIVFTYLHLAADRALTEAMLRREVTGVAYETITDTSGRLPLLTPMSEVAGRISAQIGAHYLLRPEGGSGVLMGGVPGVIPARVVVVGGGVVGSNAARIAIGMGADVTVIDKNLERLRYLDDVFGARVRTLMSNPDAVHKAVADADLVIGAALVPGAAAPKLVTRLMVAAMRQGAVIVDVAVDQGGCVETTRPTTHADPTFFVDGVLHYCVTNIPGAAPRTSTFALTNATMPFVAKLANYGFKEALGADPCLRNGVNTCHGHVTHRAVADSLGMSYRPIAGLITSVTGTAPIA